MIFALAGNQNCGKTTLFNQLTGSNQHVGNFPGVTVDQKSGPVRGQKDCTVVDLPGIYSLRPYTAEEIVTRDFILKNKPDGAGAQHDGRADRQRRQHRHGPPLAAAGRAGHPDLRRLRRRR